MRVCGGGKRTKAVQGDAGVVDDEVDALCVRLLQMLCEVCNARLICDVQVVVLDLCEATVCLEGFSLLQLRVLFELLQRCLASALVTRCEVDEKRSIVER